MGEGVGEGVGDGDGEGVGDGDGVGVGLGTLSGITSMAVNSPMLIAPPLLTLKV